MSTPPSRKPNSIGADNAAKPRQLNLAGVKIVECEDLSRIAAGVV
jgi:hypothetical protein